MTNEKTITVEGYFNQMKTLTKPEFESRWTATVQDLYGLTDSMADHHKVVEIVAQVKDMANRKFDSIYRATNK